MIISHKYKFIFIHCRKVAGSSIKTTLWPYLGNDDIMIGSLDEVMHRGYSINHKALRTMWHPNTINVSRKALQERFLRGKTKRYLNLVNTAVKARYQRSLFRNPVHPPAYLVKKRFPYEWENYFKFCFIRDPYDQALSEYSHQKRNSGRDIDFSYFLQAIAGELEDRSITPSGLISNWPLYTINDSPSINHIGQYENLENEFKWICHHIGIPLTGNLLEEKSEKKERKIKKENAYSDEDIKRVKKIYGNELKYFKTKDPACRIPHD